MFLARFLRILPSSSTAPTDPAARNPCGTARHAVSVIPTQPCGLKCTLVEVRSISGSTIHGRESRISRMRLRAAQQRGCSQRAGAIAANSGGMTSIATASATPQHAGGHSAAFRTHCAFADPKVQKQLAVNPCTNRTRPGPAQFPLTIRNILAARNPF